MEQRKNDRKSTGFDAVVSCPQFGLFRGVVENFSQQGLYVRATTVSICLRVPVSITFQPEADKPNFSYTADGLVVRQDAQGFGIRFSETDAGVYDALQNIFEKIECDDSGFAVQSLAV